MNGKKETSLNEKSTLKVSQANASSYSSTSDPESQDSSQDSVASIEEESVGNSLADNNDKTPIVEEDGGEERQQWSNPIEFLLSCIAMSVGLGNVWRFPYTAYKNGGGAFLIPYLVVLFFIGRPLYFMELAVGQFSSRSSVKVWDMVPALRGIGYGQMIANASVISYYTCLIALAVYYLIASFSAVLPWVVCDPSVQLENTVCIASGEDSDQVYQQLVANGTLQEGQDVSFISSAEQYFLHNVLHELPNIESGIGYPEWKLTLCLAGCYLLLFLILWKGVASSGKAAYFTALFPYVILITLLVRGVTLPGAVEGIYFYITPDWEKLFVVQTWYEAVVQSFFSLSVGFGALITYSSYNQFSHNVYRDALIISVADTFTSMLAGLVIFSILGNLAHELNVEVDEVVKSGTGLAFISYPTAIGKFEWMPQLFSVLFFLMLITLGLGSVTGLTSGIIAIVCDERPDWNKTKVSFGVCVVMFLAGLAYVTPGGQFILTLVDYYGGGFIIFIFTILEVIAISWVYGMQRFIRDINFMIGHSCGLYWKFCWFFFIPTSLIGILVYSIYTNEEPTYAGIEMSRAAIYAGYVLTAVACIQIPYWMMQAAFMQKGDDCTRKFIDSWKPSTEWGPKNATTKEEWSKNEADYQMERLFDNQN